MDSVVYFSHLLYAICLFNRNTSEQGHVSCFVWKGKDKETSDCTVLSLYPCSLLLSLSWLSTRSANVRCVGL